MRDLKDSLTSERDRMARMQLFDQERFRHLNVELQVRGVGKWRRVGLSADFEAETGGMHAIDSNAIRCAAGVLLCPFNVIEQPAALPYPHPTWSAEDGGPQPRAGALAGCAAGAGKATWGQYGVRCFSSGLAAGYATEWLAGHLGNSPQPAAPHLAPPSPPLSFPCLPQLHEARFQLEQASHIRRQLPAADERIRCGAGRNTGGWVLLPAQCMCTCLLHACAAFVSRWHAPSLPYIRSPTPAMLLHRRELERQLVGLRQQRAETEAALQRERAAGVGRQTAGELQEMITTLQVGGKGVWGCRGGQQEGKPRAGSWAENRGGAQRAGVSPYPLLLARHCSGCLPCGRLLPVNQTPLLSAPTTFAPDLLSSSLRLSLQRELATLRSAAEKHKGLAAELQAGKQNEAWGEWGWGSEGL